MQGTSGEQRMGGVSDPSPQPVNASETPAGPSAAAAHAPQPVLDAVVAGHGSHASTSGQVPTPAATTSHAHAAPSARQPMQTSNSLSPEDQAREKEAARMRSMAVLQMLEKIPEGEYFAAMRARQASPKPSTGHSHHRHNHHHNHHNHHNHRSHQGEAEHQLQRIGSAGNLPSEGPGGVQGHAMPRTFSDRSAADSPCSSPKPGSASVFQHPTWHTALAVGEGQGGSRLRPGGPVEHAGSNRRHAAALDRGSVGLAAGALGSGGGRAEPVGSTGAGAAADPTAPAAASSFAADGAATGAASSFAADGAATGASSSFAADGAATGASSSFAADGAAAGAASASRKGPSGGAGASAATAAATSAEAAFTPHRGHGKGPGPSGSAAGTPHTAFSGSHAHAATGVAGTPHSPFSGVAGGVIAGASSPGTPYALINGVLRGIPAGTGGASHTPFGALAGGTVGASGAGTPHTPGGTSVTGTTSSALSSPSVGTDTPGGASNGIVVGAIAGGGAEAVGAIAPPPLTTSLSPSPPKHHRRMGGGHAGVPAAASSGAGHVGTLLPVQLPGDLGGGIMPDPNAKLSRAASKPGHRRFPSVPTAFLTQPAEIDVSDFPTVQEEPVPRPLRTVRSAPLPLCSLEQGGAASPGGSSGDLIMLPSQKSDTLHDKASSSIRMLSINMNRSIALSYSIDGGLSMTLSRDQLASWSVEAEGGGLQPEEMDDPGQLFTVEEDVAEEDAEAETEGASVSVDDDGDGDSFSLEAKLAKLHLSTPPSKESPMMTPGSVDINNVSQALLEGKVRPINIVMLVVGTRGDVQPFIGIALKLKEYGHRIRIATHKVFREFVTEFGLEFYPIGGDPKVLSEFVVKHRGLNCGLNLKDAKRQVQELRSILYSSYGACVLPDPENPDVPFVADAIVANPPAYGHTHCAERLNIPMHLVFTMPWSATKQFPCPFARINMEANSKLTESLNWLSYFAIDNVAWLGLAGMVRKFRTKTLGLTDWEDQLNGAHAIHHSRVPITYIWSPSLVDRPSDWPEHCKVVGFVNVELNKLIQFDPPQEWLDFLDAGEPPIYIGFGSLVVDNPAQLTRRFMKALKATGLRAIMQKGWGGLGTGLEQVPDNVLLIGPAPHDWLFPRCSAVVHHGGAGTTAMGLYCGKPTFIVPFFGDQPFWGAACHKAGVGPAPVPIDLLKTKKIIHALQALVTPEVQQAAKQMQQRMMAEDGVANSVDHLHRTIYGALLFGERYRWMKRGPCHGAYSWGHYYPMPCSSHASPHSTHHSHSQGHIPLPVPCQTHPPAPGQGHSRNVSGTAVDCWNVAPGPQEDVEEEMFENGRWRWNWGLHFLPSDTVAQWSVPHTPVSRKPSVLQKVTSAFARRSPGIAAVAAAQTEAQFHQQQYQQQQYQQQLAHAQTQQLQGHRNSHEGGPPRAASAMDRTSPFSAAPVAEMALAAAQRMFPGHGQRGLGQQGQGIHLTGSHPVTLGHSKPPHPNSLSHTHHAHHQPSNSVPLDKRSPTVRPPHPGAGSVGGVGSVGHEPSPPSRPRHKGHTASEPALDVLTGVGGLTSVGSTGASGLPPLPVGVTGSSPTRTPPRGRPPSGAASGPGTGTGAAGTATGIGTGTGGAGAGAAGAGAAGAAGAGAGAAGAGAGAAAGGAATGLYSSALQRNSPSSEAHGHPASTHSGPTLPGPTQASPTRSHQAPPSRHGSHHAHHTSHGSSHHSVQARGAGGAPQASGASAHASAAPVHTSRVAPHSGGASPHAPGAPQSGASATSYASQPSGATGSSSGSASAGPWVAAGGLVTAGGSVTSGHSAGGSGGSGFIRTSSRKEDVAPMLPSDEWRWLSDWTVDMSGHEEGAVDDEGWYYALDFRYLKRQAGAGKCNAMHFVRRRRWVRTRTFVGPTRTRSDAGSTVLDAAVKAMIAKRHTVDAVPQAPQAPLPKSSG